MATYDEAMAAYRKELAEFEAAHPSYCRQCGARGKITWSENQAPLGSGMYWPETLADLCPHCAEQGICPLCGTPMIENTAQDSAGYEYDILRCATCGWSDDESIEASLPVAPEQPDPPGWGRYDEEAADA